jgi:hypothetical protein
VVDFNSNVERTARWQALVDVVSIFVRFGSEDRSLPPKVRAFNSDLSVLYRHSVNPGHMAPDASYHRGTGSRRKDDQCSGQNVKPMALHKDPPAESFSQITIASASVAPVSCLVCMGNRAEH